MVYESGGDVFFSDHIGALKSSETNLPSTINWTKEVLVSSGNGNAKNPAIEGVKIGTSPREEYVVWEENPWNSSGYRIYVRRRVNGLWDSYTNVLHENSSSRPSAAMPVIASRYVFWKGPDGLMVKHTGGSPPGGNVYPIVGTNANTINFSVDVSPYNEEGGSTVSLVYEQPDSGIIRYRSGTLYKNSSPPLWNASVVIATNTVMTYNSHPVLVRDNSGNACIAWEYQQTLSHRGIIKFVKVDPSGNLSPVTTVFTGCYGDENYPHMPSLSHYRNETSNKDDLDLVWYSDAQEIGCALSRAGVWSSPFLLASPGKYASINKMKNGQNAIVYMDMAGPPYQIKSTALPSSATAPFSPSLVSPENYSSGLTIPVSVHWSCVFGATSYRLQVDDNIDFSSPVDDRSGLTSTAAEVQNTVSNTTYYWRVNATNVNGTSPWSEVWAFTTGGSSGGCPFVFTWEGSRFVEENNILPQSEYGDTTGEDVTDFYKLIKPPLASGSNYTIQIGEAEHEVSSFDQFRLLVIDHPKQIEIAVNEYGEVIPYITPFKLTHATHGNNDITAKLLILDNDGVEARYGDVLTLSFESDAGKTTTFSSTGDGGVLIGGESGGHVKEKRLAKIVGGSRATSSSPFTFRQRPTLTYVPLGELEPRNLSMYVDNSCKIDFAMLAIQLPEDVYQATLVPVSTATHSTQGNVTASVRDDDGQYATLAPGKNISLQFEKPTLPPGKDRSFILVSHGHYIHLAEPSNRLTLLSPESFNLDLNYPNPFNLVTTVKYALPVGGLVNIKVFNVLGEVVGELVNAWQQPNWYEVKWNAGNAPSGVYYLHISVTDANGKSKFQASRKLLLLK